MIDANIKRENKEQNELGRVAIHMRIAQYR